MNVPAVDVIVEVGRVLSGAIPAEPSPQVTCFRSEPPDGGSESGAEDVELRIHLPGIDMRTLRVGRRDDLLVLALKGRSRTIPLPPIAVRCSIASARMEGAHLHVALTPDPRAWPGGGHD